VGLVDAVLVVVMVGVSGWGAVRLPPDARVPVHFGPASATTAVPKTTGLVLWAAVGVVTYFLAGVLAGAHRADLAARFGLTAALATILVAQTVAVAVAAGRSRRG
jgi:hypothetical protein